MAFAMLAAGAFLVGGVVAWRPAITHLRLNAARRAILDRDYHAALVRLEAAAKANPRHADVHLLLARVFRHQGQMARCRDHLESAQQYGADPRRVERERWLLLAQLGRLREAEPHIAELLDAAGNEQREACEAFVRGYLSNLKLNEAQTLLTGWTHDFPRDPEAWFLQGSMHELTSNFAEAAAAYRRAAELAPARLDVALRLSAMLAELRQTEENHRLLRQCLKTHADDPGVRFAWAQSLQAQGKLEESEQSLRALLAADPQHVEGQILLADIRLAAQDYAETIRLLTEVVRRQPHQTAARYTLARALTACGRAAEAKPHFDFVAQAQAATEPLDGMIAQAIQRPHDAALRYEIGAILWKYGSPDAAARWMRNVLELDPGHRGAQQVMQEYFSLRGSGDLALRSLEPTPP